MDINALNGPKMTEGQIQAYLARLGIFETVPRTLAGLGRIQLAHKIMVPFENLDIVAGRPCPWTCTIFTTRLWSAARAGCARS